MFDTDEVAIGRLGIRLNQGHFRALGLQDGSTAWGLWVEGRGGREKMGMPPENTDGFDSGKQGPHLVLSPIYPDLWPSTFRIGARLNREQGALPAFLDSLSRMGVNVLSLDTAIRGFDLLVVEVFANVPRLSEDVSHRLRELDKAVGALTPGDDEKEKRARLRRCVFSEIGQRLVSCAASIEARLKHDDARLVGAHGENSGMFSSASRWLGHRPWFMGADGCSRVPNSADVSLISHLNGVLPLRDDGAGTSSASGDVSLYTHVLRETSEVLRGAFDSRKRTASGVSKYNNDPYTVDPIADEDADIHIERLSEGHSKPTVVVRGLPTLAYARVWRAFENSGGGASAVDFLKFQMEGSLLACVDETQNSTKGQDDHDARERQDPEDAQLGPLRRQLYALTQQCEAGASAEGDDDRTNGPDPEDTESDPKAEESGSEDKKPELKDKWFGRWSALASLHHEERSIRLRLLRPWFSRKYAWEVEIPYVIKRVGEEGVEQEPSGSAGLLHAAVDAIVTEYSGENAGMPSEYRIENLTNTLTLSTVREEQGVIRIIVVPVKNKAADLNPNHWSTDLTRRGMYAIQRASEVYSRIGRRVDKPRTREIRVSSLHDQMERNW